MRSSEDKCKQTIGDAKEISFMCTVIRAAFLAGGLGVVIASISFASLIPHIGILLGGLLLMSLFALTGYATSTIITSLHTISEKLSTLSEKTVGRTLSGSQEVRN
jgi:hypothetical protein